MVLTSTSLDENPTPLADLLDPTPEVPPQCQLYVQNAEIDGSGVAVRRVLLYDPRLPPIVSSIGGTMVVQLVRPIDTTAVLLWELTQDPAGTPACLITATPTTGGDLQVTVYYRGFGSSYVVASLTIPSMSVLTFGITIGSDYSGVAVTVGGVTSPLVAGTLQVLTLVKIRPAGEYGEAAGIVAGYGAVFSATELAGIEARK